MKMSVCENKSGAAIAIFLYQTFGASDGDMIFCRPVIYCALMAEGQMRGHWLAPTAGAPGNHSNMSRF